MLVFLHFDIAVADFASNPIMRVSIGTNMPPPPTPPTVPNADPRNPIMVPTTIFQPNFIPFRTKVQKQNKGHLNSTTITWNYQSTCIALVWLLEIGSKR